MSVIPTHSAPHVVGCCCSTGAAAADCDLGCTCSCVSGIRHKNRSQCRQARGNTTVKGWAGKIAGWLSPADGRGVRSLGWSGLLLGYTVWVPGVWGRFFTLDCRGFAGFRFPAVAAASEAADILHTMAFDTVGDSARQSWQYHGFFT